MIFRHFVVFAHIIHFLPEVIVSSTYDKDKTLFPVTIRWSQMPVHSLKTFSHGAVGTCGGNLIGVLAQTVRRGRVKKASMPK